MKRFLLIILINLIVLIAYFNDSLKEYFEQTYHIDLKIDNIVFKKINLFKQDLENFVLNFNVNSVEVNTSLEYKCHFSLIFYLSKKYGKSQIEIEELIQKSQNKTFFKNDGLIVLGDSLMQGVGAEICNQARKDKIKCINIAKQSTGLLRKKYYNYASILNKTLKESKLKNVVMLVGVNDIWDANTNNKLLKFGEIEWKDFYINRINELVNIAKKYDANLFWYELPVIKNNEQNEKVKLLNEIFFKLANDNEYHFIKLNPILTKHFDFYIKIDGKSRKIRSNDGVHFTPLGYYLIAQDFFNTVIFE